ncbi:MAG: preprotein translocase subunit SecY, partial [Christensenellales bacterium]
MLEVIRNAWKVPELRKKMQYTLLMLLVYRIGASIPVVGVNTDFIASMVDNYTILSYLDLFVGGRLRDFTIFAMGITPYINASIIMNLLAVAIPALERLQKEGEEGKKKITRITRYLTVGLAFVQSTGIVLSLGSEAVINTAWWSYILIGLTLTAGSAFVMWLGEKITERGVGNGISLIIFVGIVSRLPWSIINISGEILSGGLAPWVAPLAIVFMLAVVVGVIFVDSGERRIPVQYAKRVVGRKMYGGQSTHIPIKVNSSGVLPIIFAMTLISLPSMIAQFWPNSGFTIWWSENVGAGTWPYMVFYALFIIFFTYFYSSISFNPVDVSKNI